jgi:signal transduction histidine kinase
MSSRPSFWSTLAPVPSDPGWELAAESIAVKIRWFGLVVGFLMVNLGSATPHWVPLNVILALGLVYTAVDTAAFRRGRVFLKDLPLLLAAMEALFIGLLCFFEGGPDSPFRFYYLLSLTCCAIRYSPRTTFVACGIASLSYAAVAFASSAALDPLLPVLMIVVFVWVTWAAVALAKLIKRAGEDLRELNDQLRENQAQLEVRIAERTRELEESQGHVLHQEKMAAFGLLAAGIAHEVGNPLTSISSLVQILDARGPDEYTREKLKLVTSQLARIQSTLRELVTFSRPASDEPGRVAVRDVVDEALGIAKYYKGGKNRQIVSAVPDGLPPVEGVRDQLVQVVFNLVLNAIDATGKGGRIEVLGGCDDGRVTLAVTDDGTGIDPAQQVRLFRPYFTTKRQGTGLGLFVSRKIVEHHGGSIECRSSAGHGTTFRIDLPAATPPGLAGAA